MQNHIVESPKDIPLAERLLKSGVTDGKRRVRVLLFCFVLGHSGTDRRITDAASDKYELIVYQNNVTRTLTPLIQRLFSLEYFKAFLYLLRGGHDVVWAQGVDAYFLASIAAFFRRPPVIIWDVSDINPRLVGTGLKSRLLRRFEKILLRRADYMIISSSEFYERHYAGSFPLSKVAVIENLLMPPVEAVREPPHGGKLRVVYSGIFRSRRLLELLRNVALKMPDTVEFHLYGSPDYTVGDSFLSALCSSAPNFRYHGRFESISDIHAESHLIVGLVDIDANLNERWLLNNRLYHAAAFHRLLLATAGSYSGQLTIERHLGVTCDLTEDSLCAVLQDLMANDFTRYKQLLAQLPEPDTAYLDGHYRKAIESVVDGRGLGSS